VQNLTGSGVVEKITAGIPKSKEKEILRSSTESIECTLRR